MSALDRVRGPMAGAPPSTGVSRKLGVGRDELRSAMSQRDTVRDFILLPV